MNDAGFLQALWFQGLEPLHIMLLLFIGRLLFAALALSLLCGLIARTRKNAAPVLRSWLWGLCVPALLLPFEHSAAFFTQKEPAPLFFVGNVDLHALQVVLAYLWLAGFVCSAVRAAARRKSTMRLIKSGGLPGCAAYFARLRSHIYLPPHFARDYTPAQRRMLLAHERQHIRQHDPLLYRVLQAIQCVFWFCPPVRTAVRLIRHDRELLCDARVTRGFSKREYGLLLLREAEKNPAGHALPGIAPEAGGMYERVLACVIPFSGGKKAAALTVCVAACLFAVGLAGLFHPILQQPNMVRVSAVASGSAHIAGAEHFVSPAPGGFAVDEKGLYAYVSAAGFAPEQTLYISVIVGGRSSLTTCFAIAIGDAVPIAKLAGAKVFLPHSEPWFTLWKWL